MIVSDWNTFFFILNTFLIIHTTKFKSNKIFLRPIKVTKITYVYPYLHLTIHFLTSSPQRLKLMYVILPSSACWIMPSFIRRFRTILFGRCSFHFPFQYSSSLTSCFRHRTPIGSFCFPSRSFRILQRCLVRPAGEICCVSTSFVGCTAFLPMGFVYSL